MYVRLAFAVAAHLEPDILIVDEVLAVGDQSSSRSRIGKMSTVARAGRTVVFVSHNMGAVLDLCTHGALLEQGKLIKTGSIEEVVAAYVERSLDRGDGSFRRVPFDPASNVLVSATLLGPDGKESDVFEYGSVMRIGWRRKAAGVEGVRARAETQELAPQPVAYATSWIGRPARASGGRADRGQDPGPPARRGHLLHRHCVAGATRERGHRQLAGQHPFRVVNARPEPRR